MLGVRSLVVVLVVAVSSRTALGGEAEDKRAECMMWAHLENKTLPLQVHLYDKNSVVAAYIR
jgi:hypothetical protein